MTNQFDFEKLYRKPLMPNTGCFSFNRVGFKIDNHPIVIFEYQDDIVFLTAQSARYKNLDKSELADKRLQEKYLNNNITIFEPNNSSVQQSGPVGLFYNDSLIDTTSLFVMNKEDFYKCFKCNKTQLNNTRKFDLNNYIKLLEQVKENINNGNYTFNRVDAIHDKNNNIINTKCKLIYTNKELFDEDYKLGKYIYKNDAIEYSLNFDKLHDDVMLNKYNSNPSENLLNELINDEIKKNINIISHYFNSFDIYTYDSYESEDNEISTKKLFGLDKSECSLIDFKTILEVDSFSDYEKDYYNDHPDEYKAKYETYLEQLKQAYEAYKEQSKEPERER